MSLSEEEFVERLKAVMGRHREPELHAVIWNYREGRMTRRELMVHPAYVAAMRADVDRMGAEMAAHGVTSEQLSEAIAAASAEQEDERGGPGVLD
jgi:hypothetical protein